MLQPQVPGARPASYLSPHRAALLPRSLAMACAPSSARARQDCSNGCPLGPKEVAETFKVAPPPMMMRSCLNEGAVLITSPRAACLDSRVLFVLKMSRLLSPASHIFTEFLLVSASSVLGLKAKDLIITPATILKEKPDPSSLVFGTVFTDHMLTVAWSSESGWEKPHIKPFENLSLHPAASALHYAVELFEGLKAFRGVDNKIRLFRPDLNMHRMCRSAVRSTLPVFDQEELLECIQQLVRLDQEWVPHSTSASLYIRPTFIGTEPSLGVKKPTKALLFVILSPVGPYFSSGTFNPVSLWADLKYVRAWEGGTGDCKMGGNYGSSLLAQCEAMAHGCQQVLWLYGKDNQITEVGTMNLFLYWINEDGEEELATPPLDGIILPGVTRQSILELTCKWGEFKVSERYLTMDDLTTALEGNRVKEMFGSGTACIVCPVSEILFKGQMLHIPTMENGPKLASRILEKLADIQKDCAP
ncbi:branched-chain-amino-acid aminotransferase, cytosolic isoform X3 [Nannospalax galili]|uniref:branched-chain-amino-acid aminotransferase, cytosolic isoform X3 n=1 Tax=Nannospalax galili TaxID=1026970 RepID=UPI00111C1A34|nr:branched-chain-amino-acid aminotransferase, cytosolic isoform X3 [Nannospalax galili]